MTMLGGRCTSGRLGRGVAIAAAAGALGAPSVADAAGGMRPGIWATPAELKKLPTSGAAWNQLKDLSERNLGRAKLSDQDSEHDIRVLATALVAARTNDRSLRKRAAAGIMEAIGTEKGGRTLALARGLQAYVIAADLIDLRDFDRGKDEVFRKWLDEVRTEKLKPSQNPNLVLTHELRPNNWGTHAGASRIAADIYLGDRKDLARAAAVFKGWLGDRGTYHGFQFGNKSWQANPSSPIAVNPPGTDIDGMSVDGALPEEMRRGCDPKPDPCATRYPWEAMQGAVAQAEMLSRQGYDSWHWGNDGLRRAGAYLFSIAERTGEEDFNAPAGHAWVPWLLNARYGARFPAHAPADPGKGLGFADWTAPIERGIPSATRTTRPVSSAAVPPSPVEKTVSDAVPYVAAAVAAVTVVTGALVLRRRAVNRAGSGQPGS
jgi:hypothetical protein